jgi:hypothetical protein
MGRAITDCEFNKWICDWEYWEWVATGEGS